MSDEVICPKCGHVNKKGRFKLKLEKCELCDFPFKLTDRFPTPETVLYQVPLGFFRFAFGPVLVTDQRFIFYLTHYPKSLADMSAEPGIVDRETTPFGRVGRRLVLSEITNSKQLELSPRGGFRLKKDAIVVNRPLTDIAQGYIRYTENKLLAGTYNNVRSEFFLGAEKVEVVEYGMWTDKNKEGPWFHHSGVSVKVKRGLIRADLPSIVFYLLDGEQTLEMVKQHPAFSGLDIEYKPLQQ
ncbi:MAG: zinc ribbon domain-containing protein [Thermocladium sp.]|jgi:hypothetical protein